MVCSISKCVDALGMPPKGFQPSRDNILLQAALESEWRRRERERESEHAALRQEYAALQSRTQQVLPLAHLSRSGRQHARHANASGERLLLRLDSKQHGRQLVCIAFGVDCDHLCDVPLLCALSRLNPASTSSPQSPAPPPFRSYVQYLPCIETRAGTGSSRGEREEGAGS